MILTKASMKDKKVDWYRQKTIRIKKKIRREVVGHALSPIIREAEAGEFQASLVYRSP